MKLTIYSPFDKNYQLEQGSFIRAKMIERWFVKKGVSVSWRKHWHKSKEQKGNFHYVTISSKSNSISAQVAANILERSRLLVDIYVPVLLEKETVLSGWNPINYWQKIKGRQVVKNILQRGGHFLVANQRQKRYWLSVANELGVQLVSDDISVLPTGVDSIKGKKLPIANCKVILWFGGIYPWMNPKLLVDAFANVVQRHKSWKLRILGGYQPGTGYSKLYKEMVAYTTNMTQKSQVEFIPWQRYPQLGHYLKDVAFAVYIPRISRNEFFAHGSRFLTLLNFGIPIVTAANDVISDLLIRVKAGECVISNSNYIAQRIEQLTNSPNTLIKWSANAKKVQNRYIFEERSTASLEEFLKK